MSKLKRPCGMWYDAFGDMCTAECSHCGARYDVLNHFIYGKAEAWAIFLAEHPSCERCGALMMSSVKQKKLKRDLIRELRGK